MTRLDQILKYSGNIAIVVLDFLMILLFVCVNTIINKYLVT